MSGVSEFPSPQAGLRRLDESRQQALHSLNSSRCLFLNLCLSLSCDAGVASHGPFLTKLHLQFQAPVKIGLVPGPGLINELVTYVKLGLTKRRMAAFGPGQEFVTCQSVPSSRIDTGTE